MDAISYCDILGKQLTAWKAKIYDVIRTVNGLPATQKETIFSSIRQLHSIVEEIDAELERLRTACAADGSPNRQIIDEKMSELQQTLKNLSEKMGGPIIPDSLSWVAE